jgi:hypothetical protein
VGEDGVSLTPVRLYRGRCPDPACPVATVTHYPSCLVPYSVFPLATHEAVLQGYAEGRSSAALAEAAGLSVKTIRRWLTRTKAHLDEMLTATLALCQKLRPTLPLTIPWGEPRQRLAALLSLLGCLSPYSCRLALLRRPHPELPWHLPIWTG